MNVGVFYYGVSGVSQYVSITSEFQERVANRLIPLASFPPGLRNAVETILRDQGRRLASASTSEYPVVDSRSCVESFGKALATIVNIQVQGYPDTYARMVAPNIIRRPKKFEAVTVKAMPAGSGAMEGEGTVKTSYCILSVLKALNLPGKLGTVPLACSAESLCMQTGRQHFGTKSDLVSKVSKTKLVAWASSINFAAPGALQGTVMKTIEEVYGSTQV